MGDSLGLPDGVTLTMVAAVLVPVGVMTVLVVYTLASALDAPGGLAPALIAGAVTLALHAWRRSSGLSILAGTAVYMLLVNVVVG